MLMISLPLRYPRVSSLFNLEVEGLQLIVVVELDFDKKYG